MVRFQFQNRERQRDTEMERNIETDRLEWERQILRDRDIGKHGLLIKSLFDGCQSVNCCTKSCDYMSSGWLESLISSCSSHWVQVGSLRDFNLSNLFYNKLKKKQSHKTNRDLTMSSNIPSIMINSSIGFSNTDYKISNRTPLINWQCLYTKFEVFWM